jgi:hypothetical protein
MLGLMDRKPAPRRPFPTSRWLLIALGAYAAAVLLYLGIGYWRSPDYQAASHYQDAQELLGPTRGGKAKREELIEAYEHLLEAARLKPEVRELHDQLEQLNGVFELRRFELPAELRHRSDAVAMTWRRIQDQHQSMLEGSLRDRGWAPDQLVEGPSRAIKLAIAGAAVIVLGWVGVMFARAPRRKTRPSGDGAARK